MSKTKYAGKNGKLQQQYIQSQQSQKKAVFDDELDEDFVDNISKTPINELEKISASFENPKGVEEDPNSNLSFGPDIDPVKLEELRKQVLTLPKDQLMALMSNMMNKKDYGLGGNDFSAVNGDHCDDIKNRLRFKLEQKRNARQTKTVRTEQYERAQSKSTLLKEKEQAKITPLKEKLEDSEQKTDDLDDVEDLDEHVSEQVPEHDAEQKPHVHSSSCSHGHCEHSQSSLEGPKPNRKAIRAANKRKNKK